VSLLKKLIDYNKLVCCFYITTKDDGVSASTIKPFDHSKLVCCFSVTIKAGAISVYLKNLLTIIS
jgi:hypothetical protein